MRRNYSLLRIAFALVTACAFFLPVRAPAPTVDIIITQFYLGFSQSIGDPGLRGPAALNIPSQTSDGQFQGFITILGNTYSITGKVDNNGAVKFTSRAGLTGTGKWQDLTRGGALILASYKLSSGDQGKIDLLRNFTQPPDPGMPPDIAGSWRGTFQNVLSLMGGTFERTIQQDRMPNGVLGTGFMGDGLLLDVVLGPRLYHFVGTVDGQRNFVSIGVSDQGFLIEGGKFESGELRSSAAQNSGDRNLDGAADSVYIFSR